VVAALRWLGGALDWAAFLRCDGAVGVGASVAAAACDAAVGGLIFAEGLDTVSRDFGTGIAATERSFGGGGAGFLRWWRGRLGLRCGRERALEVRSWSGLCGWFWCCERIDQIRGGGLERNVSLNTIACAQACA
jgi:hypothetical protein